MFVPDEEEKNPHVSQKSEGLRHPKIQSQRLRRPPTGIESARGEVPILQQMIQ
jgi:hypothetical protein